MLIYFIAIWYVSWPFWYIFWLFGLFFPVLVHCTNINLGTLSSTCQGGDQLLRGPLASQQPEPLHPADGVGAAQAILPVVVVADEGACRHRGGAARGHALLSVVVAPGVDVMITIFGDFCQISAKILAFLSNTNVMTYIFAKN
jgi:hypothetical protein